MMIIMVHGTYHPSLTGGSFIIDKTQHAWLTYFICYSLFAKDHVNSNNHKPMAYNKHRI